MLPRHCAAMYTASVPRPRTRWCYHVAVHGVTVCYTEGETPYAMQSTWGYRKDGIHALQTKGEGFCINCRRKCIYG